MSKIKKPYGNIWIGSMITLVNSLIVIYIRLMNLSLYFSPLALSNPQKYLGNLILYSIDSIFEDLKVQVERSREKD